jgi:glycosyltransferase involved in cell wall biosynthesis
LKKLLIFAKTLDGGTGTYLNTLLKIRDITNKEFIISVAALEKPVYMQQSGDEFNFMKKRDYSLDKYSFSYKNLSGFIKEFFWFKKIILEEKPDIILAVDVNCNIHTGLNKFLCRKNFKTIFTTHSDLDGNLDQKSTKFLKFLLKKNISFFYNRADLNICVSKDLSNSLVSNFGIKSKSITIFNGLELPGSHKEIFEPGNNRILSVARLDKQKDHLTLLKAFELVTNKIKNAYLLLVGDGPLKNELINFVTKNNFDKNVEFVGWQNDIKNFFLDSDIFVLSSNREGFPYALIEAMSFGLPVVCTDTPYGPREILDGGKYGYLIPMRDHIKMKEAILELLENEENYKKYSQLAFERSRLYTSERMVKEYANVIKDLVRG